MLKSIKDNDLIFVVFCGCFALLFLIAMHYSQQNKLVKMQSQIDELKIVVEQLSLK